MKTNSILFNNNNLIFNTEIDNQYLNYLNILPIDLYCQKQIKEYEGTQTILVSYMFIQNSNLQKVSFPKCTAIKDNCFYNCASLKSVFLLNSQVCGLQNVDAFRYTPIADSSYLGYFGSIYVPSSLLNAYKTATNWVNYSNRLVGV